MAVAMGVATAMAVVMGVATDVLYFNVWWCCDSPVALATKSNLLTENDHWT